MNFIVEVNKTDKSVGVKKGEVYMAEPDDYDEGKCTLLARIPDGYDPGCNHYWNEVIIIGTHFIPSRTFDKRRKC